MNERDDTNLSAEESISDEISERVRSVISAAESAATAIRHEAEQEVQTKRRAAEAERERFLEHAKSEAEALLDQRIKRIAELSDSIIEGAESLLMRIGGAQEVKRQLETMVHALAHTAENLAAESEQGRLAPVARPIPVDDEPEPRIQAVPEPEPEAAAPEPANVTELRVPEPEPHVQAEPQPVPVPEEAPVVTEAAAPPVEETAAAEEEPEVVDAVEVVEVPGEEAAPSAEGPGPEAPRGFDGDDLLAARLVALQMAVAGSARDEVEAHLRKTFSLDEPGAILNDVFGTESKL
jgi:F0F1-type ATP synthase membrane subunit b/b'